MRNSIFDIKIDLDRSTGSYLFDSERKYLDFFGMFSSLPLGYNHPVFDNTWDKKVARISKVRITNCEFDCDEREEFEVSFERFAGVHSFTHFHYACTGALAVEFACKEAIKRKNIKDPVIVSHANSFHGITSYGNMTTGRTKFVGPRLSGFPGDWPKFSSIEDLENILRVNKNIAGILMEPVQSTGGDVHYPEDFFRSLRFLATYHGIPLIFDEIQTGFCVTGEKWYFQHTGITPDIVVFGKKSQVCGIMSLSEFSCTPSQMCVTWDADVVDMLRSTYVIRAIEQGNLIENARTQGLRLLEGLRGIGLEPRGIGLLVAFDLENKEARDTFYSSLKSSGMLCNPTGEKSIRLRPNLAVTSAEVDEALRLIKSCL